MNELTYILAILVRKDVLTVQEAAALKKEGGENVITSNLGEMITKVDRALRKKASDVEKLDARDIIGK